MGIILAKLSIVTVQRGYWGTSCCGSMLAHHLIPAPKGTGIVSAPVLKKMVLMAGIDNCYTSSRGGTATPGNFAKATFDAISKTY
jgi:small subunit ribosomal protein S2e